MSNESILPNKLLGVKYWNGSLVYVKDLHKERLFLIAALLRPDYIYLETTKSRILIDSEEIQMNMAMWRSHVNDIK